VSNERTGVFAGIRVADFAWVGVGPIVSKYLADHGAEVIRIESNTYPEALRRAPPFVDDEPGVDRSGYYANFNSSKLGVSLNLKHPQGGELVRRLVEKCDVVTESFTPGTMERFGIGVRGPPAGAAGPRDDRNAVVRPDRPLVRVLRLRGMSFRRQRGSVI